MSNNSILTDTSPSVARDPHDARTIAEKASSYRRLSRAEATLRAYATDFADFESYANDRGESALPASAELVEQYVSHLADRAALSTIRRRVVSISLRHQALKLTSPTTAYAVREAMRGITRHKTTRQRSKSAMTSDLLKIALRKCGDDVKGTRDRAIMLLGFAGAFRRSEIAALDVDDVRFEARGAIVTLRRSKTDQEGRGREVAFPYLRSAMCPVAALRAWIKVAGIERGPLFVGFALDGSLTRERISGRLVERVVNSLAKKAGLEGDFGAHSLRAGFVTSAAERHIETHRIAKVTGHKSQAVLAGYIRSAQVWDDSPLAVVMRKR